MTDTVTVTKTFTIEQAAKAAKIFNDLYRRPTSNLEHALWMTEQFADWEALTVFINAQRETIAFDYCKTDSNGAPLRDVQGNLTWASNLNIQKAEKAIDETFKVETVPTDLVPEKTIPVSVLRSFELSPAEVEFLQPFINFDEDK